MSKAQRGDRSFQPSAGKGDSSRITDVEAFRNNYDQIDWGHGVIPILYKRNRKKRLLTASWYAVLTADEQITEDDYQRDDW